MIIMTGLEGAHYALLRAVSDKGGADAPVPLDDLNGHPSFALIRLSGDGYLDINLRREVTLTARGKGELARHPL